MLTGTSFRTRQYENRLGSYGRPFARILKTSAAVLIVAITGCVCTEVGCVSGLTVTFDGDPDSEYTMMAFAEGHEPAVRECSAGADCVVFFGSLVASHVMLRYTSQERGSIEREYYPTYAPSRPNGLFCPPVCEHAEVTFVLE